MSDLKKINDICCFIKKSMCVNGTVELKEFKDIEIDGKKIRGAIFKVTDCIRNKFYIGWFV